MSRIRANLRESFVGHTVRESVILAPFFPNANELKDIRMKIAIYGYGNLGRGVECAVRQNSDAELVGVFTRRAPETVKTHGRPGLRRLQRGGLQR